MARPTKNPSQAASRPVTNAELKLILAILKNNKAELNLDWDAVARDVNQKTSSVRSTLSALRKRGLVPYAGMAADTQNAEADTAQPDTSTNSNSKTAKAAPRRRAPGAGRKRKLAPSDNTTGTATTTGATAASAIEDDNNRIPPANKNKKAKVQKIPFLADSGSESDNNKASAMTHHHPLGSVGGIATASRDYYERLAQSQIEADEQLQGDIVRCTKASDRYNAAIAGAHRINTTTTTASNPIASARRVAFAETEAEAARRQAAQQAAVDDDYDDGYSDGDSDDMQTHPGNASDQIMFAQIAHAAGYDHLIPPAVL